MSYITRRPKARRPMADWDDDIIGPLHITVHEPDDEPEYTGILDQHGNELCRVRDRLPMGFRVK